MRLEAKRGWAGTIVLGIDGSFVWNLKMNEWKGAGIVKKRTEN